MIYSSSRLSYKSRSDGDGELTKKMKSRYSFVSPPLALIAKKYISSRIRTNIVRSPEIALRSEANIALYVMLLPAIKDCLCNIFVFMFLLCVTGFMGNFQTVQEYLV